MAVLEPPIKRYLSGARPSHSKTSEIANNFKNIDANTLATIFQAGGYFNGDNKPTQKCIEDGLIDSCDKKILWNLNVISETLEKAGVKLERNAVNQEIVFPEDGEPVWANLGTIGTYFSVTANQIGKWLDDLNYREKNMPTKDAMDAGLAILVEMNAGGKKTRQVAHWNLHVVQQALVDAGHELNFNYEESLRGKGKNSDVNVSAIDQRAADFAREFAKMYKNADTRENTKKLVKSTPLLIQQKAETLLKRPGFITKGEYLKNL